MNFTTAPQIYVEIYPFEGGQFSIQGGNAGILQAQINKNIRDSNPGTFSLTLAPGGPYGPNVRPSWTELLTPMSLAIIGIARGTYRQIVMIGNVLSCQESTVWDTKGAHRSIIVQGQDFQQFFTQPSYYTLSFLAGAVAGTPAANANGFQGFLSDSELVGSPDTFGAAWYRGIMAGPGSIMANLTFAYMQSRLAFYNIVSQYWQPYDANISIPMGAYFMLSDGSWMDKFMSVFPFPYYEFFVTTAPTGFYGTTTAASTSFTLPGFPAANPQIVARVNPLPWVKPTATSANSTTLPPSAMDLSKWNALQQYQPEHSGPSGIQHSIGFDDGEVRNFYVINPTILSATFGQNNANNTPFLYSYAAFADTASIHRYGYRPEISELQWFSDPTGAQAQAFNAQGVTENQFDFMVTQLASRLFSYYEPTPLMARGTVVMRLRPDILPGNIFSYSPWKSTELWQFYIEGFSHNFVFGGESTTSLQLSRGLPKTVYGNLTLLQAIHTGNSGRANGEYLEGGVPGLGNPLLPVNFQTFQSVIGGIAQSFYTPQFAGS